MAAAPLAPAAPAAATLILALACGCGYASCHALVAKLLLLRFFFSSIFYRFIYMHMGQVA